MANHFESTTASRNLLAIVAEAVKKAGVPDMRKATVEWLTKEKVYEFKYEGFSYKQYAPDAYAARAEGWKAWLEHQAPRLIDVLAPKTEVAQAIATTDTVPVVSADGAVLTGESSPELPMTEPTLHLTWQDVKGLFLKGSFGTLNMNAEQALAITTSEGPIFIRQTSDNKDFHPLSNPQLLKLAANKKNSHAVAALEAAHAFSSDSGGACTHAHFALFAVAMGQDSEIPSDEEIQEIIEGPALEDQEAIDAKLEEQREKYPYFTAAYESLY